MNLNIIILKKIIKIYNKNNNIIYKKKKSFKKF